MPHALSLFARPIITNYCRTIPGKNHPLEGSHTIWAFSWRSDSILAPLCSLQILEEWSVQNYSLYTGYVGFIKNATNSWFWKEILGLSFSDFLKPAHLCILFCFGLLACLTCSQCVTNSDWPHSGQTGDTVACISWRFLNSFNSLHVPLIASFSQLESLGNLFNRKYKLYKS